MRSLLNDAFIQISVLHEKIQDLQKENLLHRNLIQSLEEKISDLQSQSIVTLSRENLSSIQTKSVANDDADCENKIQVERTLFVEENRSTTSNVTNNCRMSMKTQEFTEWMESSEVEFSLWNNISYRNALLKYMGKLYGLRNSTELALELLNLGSNKSNELYQLYLIIRELEQQPGAKESLQKWQSQARSEKRLSDIQTMFDPENPRSRDLILKKAFPMGKVIDRKCIHGYFDFICRDGFITVKIGEYLQLHKNDIFGGNDYDSHNNCLTHVNIDLAQSKIHLVDNCVDLITCFVVLHRVAALHSILLEFVRILRSNGYLILREHGCETEHSITNKYLNFIQAFMRIAKIGEFAHLENNSNGIASNWERQKAEIIKITSSNQYRTRQKWHEELENVGFRRLAELDYPRNSNLQKLFYAVYQLNKK
ncbi:unnamed protein product [Adineta ricciae]|uniref:Methyltransferase type 11 domain-containing protein n=1 Tax=Adineta ricciae TaxID=249248 RepID=A0A814K9Z2_ADIRI|nr:unnamed protein product [Adineta ricciae]CAF1276182.1 unnamed protein product [Adineta ricciae]